MKDPASLKSYDFVQVLIRNLKFPTKLAKLPFTFCISFKIVCFQWKLK